MFWDKEYNYIESSVKLMDRWTQKCELMSAGINSMPTDYMLITVYIKNLRYYSRK
jgi:hypothetical protein